MKFETLLARRYISAQKRHAVLTVCSISIAVALMSMLFCLLSTYISIKRNEAYDDMPGHFAFYNITEEQAEKLKSLPEVSKVERTDWRNGWTATYVTINQYIEDDRLYAIKLEEAAGLTELKDDDEINYFFQINHDLLAIDLLNDNGRVTLAFYFGIFFILVLILMLLLRLVIDTAFEISSKERERQFGVMQSIGATPKQIVRVMTVEGLYLSGIGVPLGGALGVLLGYITFRAVLTTGISSVIFDSPEKISKYVRYSVNPWMLAAGMLLGFVWVMFSAYGTGMRVIRKSPMEAMTARQNTVKKIRRFSLSGILFGWTGKLAFRNTRRQKKRFVITVLSLTISLMMFAIFGTVMNRAEAFVRSTRYEIDMFGYKQSDFELMYDNLGSAAEGEPGRIGYLRAMEDDGLPSIRYIKALEDSGFFQDIEFNKILFSNKMTDYPDTLVDIAYINRETYDRIWKYTEEPMSYDEFVSYGKAIVFHEPNNVLKDAEGEVTIDLHFQTEITEEEARIAEENQEPFVTDGNGTEEFPFRYYQFQTKTADFPYGIRASSPYSALLEWELVLLYPAERYESDLQHYGYDKEQFLGGSWLSCNLKKGAKYQDAISYLESEPNLVLTLDNYTAMQNASTIIAAVKVAGLFITLMISLIAIINMVNIISTGIINRKPELAAMQCSGMTHGQMYRMAAIECLQFVLRSAILAGVLSCLIIFGTEKFLYWLIQGEATAMYADPTTSMMKNVTAGLDEGHIASYSLTLLKIGSASAAAFVVAMIASLIPLHRMQKEPLIEQIRAVE
ncbi:MAG: FtsX-like permease family protein [Oscillospiraceae bacterium]|nr:FtsX-like permease family protein [Oscillospiraceae bacterium]